MTDECKAQKLIVWQHKGNSIAVAGEDQIPLVRRFKERNCLLSVLISCLFEGVHLHAAMNGIVWTLNLNNYNRK